MTDVVVNESRFVVDMSDEIKDHALRGGMVLPDGRVVTGRTSDTLGAASAMLLNALKALGGIADQFELISAQVLEPVCRLKTQYLGHKNPRLHTDEVLMALTISALTNPLAELAQQQLPKLRGCDAHFTVILSDVDEKLLKRLGINVSCEAKYENSSCESRFWRNAAWSSGESWCKRELSSARRV